MKLFVSYRSTDSSKVDPIVHRLRSLKYEVWQDKDSIPVGQDWWQAICHGIYTADVFLFMVSEESVKSFACLAELSYAHELNLPIIPFVIEGEWIYNAGGKYDIEFWDDIPEELNESRVQFLFYEGVGFVEQLKTGIETILAKNVPRLPASPPPDPRKATDETNDVTVIYDEAYDFAYRGELDHAKKLFRKLVNHNDPIFGDISLEWVHIIDNYSRIKNMASRRSTRKIARGQWESYIKQFPKDFIDGIFDPNNIPQLLQAKPTLKQTIIPAKPSSINLMPKPFDWIEITAGQVTLGKGWTTESPINRAHSVGQIFNINRFEIAKYPITNAQFRKFIEARGYNTERWWTKDGWAQKQKDGWTEPDFWGDGEWNGDSQPVVGVSWFESVAFCLWLSDVTGEKIMLPTEQQWQFAAQGTERLTYPWGNDWNRELCNNNVDGKGIGKTTPVTRYEGKGESPFGVVDMAGNVWEWCLTGFESGSNDVNATDNTRALRGSSCLPYGYILESFQTKFRNFAFIDKKLLSREKGVGFRISRFN